MDKLIKKYTKLGVDANKLIVTVNPSVCLYSISRKCLVGGNGQPDAMETIQEGNNVRLSYENNRIITLQVRTELDIKEINDSAGIIITVYGRNAFRFGFIPTE